ncbi:MAG: hypothetical protein JW927_03115 [Deltaproteobacteria bacterium]|nr:hypothetical protein [Deltaproteobacteria bacterium]
MIDDKLYITPPLYMVGIKTSCWRCEARMTVIGLLDPNVKDVHTEVATLTNIAEIPKDVISIIQKRVPTFMKRGHLKKYCPK